MKTRSQSEGTQLKTSGPNARQIAATQPEIEALTSAASLFHSFSDPSRLMILHHLQLGEHRVVDLVRHLGLSQSTVSQHLACLKDADMVTARAEGRASVYALKHPDALVDLLSSAERILALTGDAVTLCPIHGKDAISRHFTS